MDAPPNPPRFYDARGNVYGVVAPSALAAFGVPATARDAALCRLAWAPRLIAELCGWPGPVPPGAKAHRSDGLLIGPFQDSPPFDLLIVNTDGTLAERSGNGLTIFATALAEQGLFPQASPVTLNVHHDGTTQSPASVVVTHGSAGDGQGFWVELGRPGFGPEAVAARPDRVIRLAETPLVTVPRLAALDPRWDRTVFVRVGNPHAVTFLPDESQLPGMAQLREAGWLKALTRIAFAEGSEGEGDPCPAGVNLQWAARRADGSLAARVFERGEGPTESSGTSATAVASAALRLGLVAGPRVEVHMPGGTAPLEAAPDGAMRLFGTARLLP